MDILLHRVLWFMELDGLLGNGMIIYMSLYWEFSILQQQNIGVQAQILMVVQLSLMQIGQGFTVANCNRYIVG